MYDEEEHDDPFHHLHFLRARELTIKILDSALPSGL